MMSAPNTTSGRSRRTSAQKRDRVGAQVAPLHALEDQVVAGLQRQMQMRHQARLVGERVEQVAIGLDRIDRRQPQPRQSRHMLEDLLHQRAELRRARQVARRSW